MYPQYKAGRKPPPPDFYEQIPVLHKLLEAFGWPLYELDDYEADDIMGALAVQAAKQDIETMLITSDLDMLQLVDPHIHVFALKKGLSNIELYSPKSFEAKYGIAAEQFLDLKALKGDSSDNIPGVPGIGEKGALDLLKAYHTLDGVYENIDLIKDSIRAKLLAGKDSAYLSKKIAAIWTDAPIQLNLSHVDGSLCDPKKVHDLLQSLEFRSLVRQLPEVMQITEQHEARDVFEHGFDGTHVVVDSDKALKAIDFDGAETWVIHSRAAGKHGKNPQLLILSPNPQTVYTLKLETLNKNLVGTRLGKIKGVVGYDTKSTLKVLLELGVELPAVEHDVLVGAFLLNSLRRVQTLTELAAEDLGYTGTSLDELPPDELEQRAPEITTTIHSLYDVQRENIAQDAKLTALSSKVEWPVIPVLARMEYEGIQLNTEYLQKFSVEITDAISDLEQQIYGHANHEFNISSPSQLADVLFTKLNLPTTNIKKGKTGYSTAVSELDKLRASHPIIDLISQYREVTKLKNTYVDTLPMQVDERSRVHTTFSLTVAQTGRLSSNDPNLQNIPVRTDLGRRIRTAFVAGPGNVFVNADYSQFELRLAAALSGDQGMIDAFNSGTDIHAATSAAIYGIPVEQVTKQQRYSAKAVNFGIMYGQGPHGLSAGTGMSFVDARDFIAKYFQIRPKLKEYIDSLREKAKNDGYVETLLGRRRPTPDVNSSNFAVREAAYRAAINMPIQGTAADLTKLAMVELDKKLATFKAKQLLQVHDSILLEAPQSEAEKVADIAKQTMQNIHPNLPVSLAVDISIAKTWGDL
jgi:DNA polymerase-1